MKTYSLRTMIAMLLMVSLIAGSVSPAQTPPKPTGQPTLQTKARRPRSKSQRTKGNRASVVTSGDEDYRIGAGDLLEVRVGDAEELSGEFRVRADGTLKMHFLGRIVALNKTTEDLARDIADGLRGKYLFEPRVSIYMKELTSKSIYLQGAVAKPGYIRSTVSRICLWYWSRLADYSRTTVHGLHHSKE
jgi:protein involved in polysaccharide export with SLBB domain